jgi:hypothetical protein
MGFYSFNTADTQESIPNTFSGKDVKPVFLLQPNGAEPIREDAYEGYGEFGGVACYNWLAKQNFNDETKVGLAINADCGHYFEDDNGYYCCAMHVGSDDLRLVVPNKDKPIHAFENYSSLLPNINLSVNDAIEKQIIQRRKIELKYPLKFSFDPDAKYEDLHASESCEYQGFFYPE